MYILEKVYVYIVIVKKYMGSGCNLIKMQSQPPGCSQLLDSL